MFIIFDKDSGCEAGGVAPGVRAGRSRLRGSILCCHNAFDWRFGVSACKSLGGFLFDLIFFFPPVLTRAAVLRCLCYIMELL